MGTGYQQLDFSAWLQSDWFSATNTMSKPRRRPDATQIEIIQRCEGSVRQVAREIGVSKSTVHRYRQLVYDRWEAEEPEVDEGPSINFQRLATPKRCPTHGLSWFDPCPICTATGTFE